MDINRKHTLAKISGITLEQHCSNVISEALKICSCQPATIKKYYRIVGKDLLQRVEVTCQLHDDGKAEPRWQKACICERDRFLEWELQHKDGTLQDYEKACKGDVGSAIRNCGIRHEFFSLRYNETKRLPISLQVAIAAHHGKLGQSFKQRWEELGMKSFWDKFAKESNDMIESENLQAIAKKMYEYDGVRSLLQQADHRASALEENAYVPELTVFSYNFPYTKKRSVQRLIESNWNEDLLLVRAPTGAGKTDAALLWASKQIEHGRAERLIIAMPTRFTSNALSVSIAEDLSDTGLYHSSAWFNIRSEKQKNGTLNKYQALNKLKQARLLENAVTICTLDHLLMGLTLTREDHHTANFNLANSCLVIDEADFYDDFTQQNIYFLLTILHLWHVPVLVMSASLPQSVIQQYQKTGYKVHSILEDTSDNLRSRFCITAIIDYEDVAEIDDALEKMIQKGNGIIYANTVDRAIEYYNHIEKLISSKGLRLPVILYHSRFTDPDKQLIEDKLLKHLGKEAWQNQEAQGIAILTQIGEMSVNISADFMLSEMCPIDRLTQRAGRLCRFNHAKTGDLIVLNPHRKGCFYPAPYGEYNRKEKKWEPFNALLKTIDLLHLGRYNAQTLVELINEVYSNSEEPDIASLQNAQLLKDNFINNWLIRPVQKTKIDDNDTNLWRSRKIGAQDVVFVKAPDSLYFKSYSDFMEYKLLYGISIPVYLIERCRKMNRLNEAEIHICSPESLQVLYISVIREGFYNREIGIDLTEGDFFI